MTAPGSARPPTSPGAGLHDDAVSIPVVGVQHRTLLAFLSSGCLTCRGFWDAFDRPDTLGLPADVRLVVVTKDAAEESLHTLRELAPRDLAVVMSSAAWEHYTVPGSPYFALVDGAAGRVVGEGTGASWDQVQSLLAHADRRRSRPRADRSAAAPPRPRRASTSSCSRRASSPGDPRLYRTADELTRTPVTLRRAMTELAAHGVARRGSAGWEGRILRRAGDAIRPSARARSCTSRRSRCPRTAATSASASPSSCAPATCSSRCSSTDRSRSAQPMFAAQGIPRLTRRPVLVAAAATNAARPDRLPALLHRRNDGRSASTSWSPVGCTCGRVVAQVNTMLDGAGRSSHERRREVVTTVSNGLATKTSRRGFLFRPTLVGSALAVNPLRFLLRPGTAYASLCGPDASCSSGWTVFCCSINNGRNACPPGSIPAGWWKTDRSGFCEGGPRYIIDCNATCGTCGCGGGGICAPGCYNCGCHCGTGSCDERLVCCNQFRYGQCHQELACVGPVVCRVASCRPPWEVDPTCTTASATANETALHTAPCLDDSANVFVTAFGGAPQARRAAAAQLRAGLVGIAATPSGKGYWLVARRRRRLHVRRRALPRLDRRHPHSTNRSSAWRATPHRQRATGSSPPTAASSPSATRASTARLGSHPTPPTDRRHGADAAPARATGSSPPTAASSPSATRTSTAALGGVRLHQPIVGMAPHPTGRGYWLVAADGGIFTFGDAHFHGGLGGIAPRTNRSSAWHRTHTGKGYWLVAADGGIFTFGDAHFHGGLGDSARRAAATSSGWPRPRARGYWVASQR